MLDVWNTNSGRVTRREENQWARVVTVFRYRNVFQIIGR